MSHSLTFSLLADQFPVCHRLAKIGKTVFNYYSVYYHQEHNRVNTY